MPGAERKILKLGIFSNTLTLVTQHTASFAFCQRLPQEHAVGYNWRDELFVVVGAKEKLMFVEDEDDDDKDAVSLRLYESRLIY